MAIEFNFQMHNKKRIAIMGGILVLLGICTASMSDSQSREPYVAPTASRAASTSMNNAGTNVADSSEQAVNINPFIEVKEFDPQVQNITELTSTNSYENNTVHQAKPSNIPLPVIPNYNAGNYQSRPQQAESVAKANAVPMPLPASPVTIQGIGTGGNNGSNIAILSDGRVVSEGDTYNDGRIAYIGDDGITFDNGKKLQYK